MKKWIKFLSVAVAILIALIVALVVLANVLITPERIKATLLPLAEDNLHRKIDLGEIKVSLFSGIEISGLRIYEQDGLETFVSTDLVRLRYQLLPLLAMKVVIDEVRLEKPSIRIVRLRNGQFNFSDLAGTAAKPAAQAENSPQPPGGTPISLLVTHILLQDGQLVFLDHVLNDKAPYRYEVSALQIAAKGVSLSGDVPLSIQCQLNGSPLSLDGTLNLASLHGNFEVELQNLDAVPFTPYFQDALPGKLGGLKLNLKSTVAGSLDEISLQGTLALAEIDLLLDALPDAPLKDASFSANYDFLLNRRGETLDLRKLDLDYNGIKVSTKGGVTGLMGKPALDLAVTVPNLQIGQAVEAIPQGLIGDLRSFDPTGTVTAEASLSGPMDAALGLLKSATIELDNVQADAGGQRPAFSGRLLLAGAELSSKGLQVRLGDNNADIDFNASHIFSKPVNVRANITSERFLLEPLLVGSAAPAAALEKGGGTAEGRTATSEIGPFDIPLQATGSIKITETVWKGLVIKDFLAQYELKNNIFNLTRMDGQVAGGSFSNSARVDLGKKGLAYSAILGLKTIQADPLLTALLPPAAGRLIGAMDMSLVLDGRGTQWQSLSRTLNGNGDMLVADGRLISPELVKGLSSFLQLPELNDIKFDNFTGQFKVTDGKVTVDSQMRSDMLKLTPKGTIGLDGSLNLELDTRLSPALTKKMDNKGGVMNYLVDSDGWTRLPLLLKGTFNAPSFGLDPKGVQEQASKAIGNELERQIDKFFKQKTPAPAAGGQHPAGGEPAAVEDPARKQLQDSLQKLFGN